MKMITEFCLSEEVMKCQLCDTNEADHEGIICHECKNKIDQQDFEEELRFQEEQYERDKIQGLG